MSGYIRGKALLVITRRHSESGNHFDVHAFIQASSGGWEHRDAAQEEFQHLEYDVLPLPNPAYRLEVGETMRIAVTFTFSYHRYSDGEVHVDLDYDKVRVRRHQRPRVRYISTKGQSAGGQA